MKQSLKDQKILSRVLITPEDYENRHIPHPDCQQDTDRPLSAVVLITAGCVLGLLVMFAAQSCDREPMPAVVKSITGDIHCQYCHGVKLNNQQRYTKYWKARHKYEQTQVASGRDDDTENERMMRLIVGGR